MEAKKKDRVVILTSDNIKFKEKNYDQAYYLNLKDPMPGS